MGNRVVVGARFGHGGSQRFRLGIVKIRECACRFSHGQNMAERMNFVTVGRLICIW